MAFLANCAGERELPEQPSFYRSLAVKGAEVDAVVADFQAAGVRHLAILAGFLLLSEGLKIASLWYCRGGAQGIKR